MTPYYEHAGNSGRFQKGDPKLKIKTDSHRLAISEGQRRAWQTKRARMPIGTKWIDAGGYVRVKVAERKGRWRLEHVVVMEQRIGRSLKPEEIVHHVDGNRANNVDENLFLCRDHAHHMEVERQLKETFRLLLKVGAANFSHDLGVYQCR